MRKEMLGRLNAKERALLYWAREVVAHRVNGLETETQRQAGRQVVELLDRLRGVATKINEDGSL